MLLLLAFACDNHDLGSPKGNDSGPIDALAVIDIKCSPCHIGGGTSGDLALDDFDALVGAPSGQSDLALVTAGDPEASYLIYKVRGEQDEVGEGDPMPPTGLLDEAEILALEDHIASLDEIEVSR